MAKYFITVILPVILGVAGVYSMNRPPTEINNFFGYRTPRSMRDKRSWDYAQKMMGEYMIYYAIITLVLGVILSVLCRIFFDRAYLPFVILLLQTLAISVIIFKIELTLKKEHKRWDEK